MQGMCGMSDFRDIAAAVDAGDEAATLAMEVYVHRLRKYVGSYAFALGGLDTIAFTAGRSEEHTSELQSRGHLVCRLLLEKTNPKTISYYTPNALALLPVT